MPFQTALVTGASSGIGEALCRLLDKQGIALVMVGRREDRMQEIADTLSGDAHIVVADLATDDGIRAVSEVVDERVPDLVINNAGLGLYGQVCEIDLDKQRQLLRVNADAVMALSMAAGRALLRQKKRGCILNISSVAAYQLFPSFAVYAASKAFVNVFTESLAEELRGDGIDVLLACPGQVDTRFRNRAAQEEDKGKAPGYVMTAEYAAQRLWRQIQAKQSVLLFDWRYRLGAFFTRYVLPRRLVAWFLRRNIENRIHE